MLRKMFFYALGFMLLSVAAHSQTTQSDTVWSKFIGSEVKAVKFSPDGQFIYAAAIGRKPMKLSTETGEILMEYDGVTYVDVNDRSNLDISKDGKYLYSGDDGNMMYIWDTETGAIVHNLSVDYDENEKPYFKSISTSNQYIAALIAYKKLINGIPTYTTETHIWNINTLKKIKILASFGGHTIKFSPQGNFLTFIKSTGPLLLNTGTWDIFTELLGHTGYVTDIAFSPDGSLLASCGWGGEIKIWDIEQKKISNELISENYYLTSVIFKESIQYITGGSGFTTGGIEIWYNNNSIPIKKYKIGSIDFDFFANNKLLSIASGQSILLIDLSKITSVSEHPNNESLVTPNPGSNSVKISFHLPEPGKIQVEILDLNSNQISLLHAGFMEAGNHNLNWLTKGIPSGTYYCIIKSKNSSETLKIIVNK